MIILRKRVVHHLLSLLSPAILLAGGGISVFYSQPLLAALPPPHDGVSQQDQPIGALPLPNSLSHHYFFDQENTTQVIVQLALSYASEKTLHNDEAVQRQRASIQQMQAQVMNELAAYDARPVAAWQTIPFMALRVDRAGLKALQASPSVVAIQQDELAAPLLASSTVAIGAPVAWSLGVNGAGQTIVLLDTGIDTGHPFVNGRTVAEVCFSNGNNSGPYRSLCPDTTGFQTGPGAADTQTETCLLPNGSTLCWHGVHVTGIAAGADPGGLGYSGVAPGATIIAIQVFTRIDEPTLCRGQPGCLLSYTSDQISALEYIYTTLAVQHVVAAVNMSLGGGSFDNQADCDSVNGAIKAAIDNLRAINIPTIAAAGNSGAVNALVTPACVSSAVAVGSIVDANDTISTFSAMSEMVDLLAPGSSVVSSIPGGGYRSSGGTSMAAPHVAGAWALLRQAEPNASVDEVLSLLQATGKPVTDTRPEGTVTKPRLDLERALDALGLTRPQVNIKVLLQGAFRDIGSGSGFLAGTDMRDTLRALELADGLRQRYLPHREPFTELPGFENVGSGGESMTDPAVVLADRGADSIVDWIFIELHNAADPDVILATRAALVQRDGDVVDVDGVSPVVLDNAASGNYYVAIRHRNHLGVMTANALPLLSSGANIDFTEPSQALWHASPVANYPRVTLNGRAMLWAGDANSDGSITLLGSDSDATDVSRAVLNAPDNLLHSQGYVRHGYFGQDVDLNGLVAADGVDNEHGLIYNNVVFHPANEARSQAFQIIEQLPAAVTAP